MTILSKTTNECSSTRIIRCQDCALSPICLPLSVQEEELPKLDAIIERKQALPKNSLLFKQGDTFNRVYIVRSGAIKTTSILDNGLEQITGFYLPGDIIGLESISSPTCLNNAQALETTTICAIPYTDLRSLGSLIPSLQDHIFNLMSREIYQGHHAIITLSKLNAQQRVSMFLLNLSSRYQRRHLSGDHFHLPISRGDLANYLGLTIETVSRIFTQLQQTQILEMIGKDLHILDRNYLCELIGIQTTNNVNE